MPSVTTYSEWTDLLTQFGDGNDISLEKLKTGTFTIDAGTASRFYRKVEEVYKKRKQHWLDRFQHSFRLQSFGKIDDFEMLLRNGKQNLYPLTAFIALKGLPEDLRKTLKKDIEGFVAEIKKSLKENVSKSSNEREKMLILLNSFGINGISENTKVIDGKVNEIIAATGRKIIF
ncbi:hypothetical protein DBR43_30440 [Pedobacter sp. KBW06]|uniref:hypothetical protein n=1 Tax=Pedobacter sp. KBW06 TaxID=2153359 RepID=UPI000F5B0527|nr:hypothetical protein [Pedobacter sp. KBW06]RQO65176.1 hypothetical protein DBR43_30440 [Pedobacter sp. KBW06]